MSWIEVIVLEKSLEQNETSINIEYWGISESFVL